MPKAVDRIGWVTLGLQLLDEGTLPFKPTIDEAAARLGLTKGSFYTHFTSAAAWHTAICEQYLAERERSRSGRKSGAVEDSKAKMWVLRADAVLVTERDRQMELWASLDGAPGAESAGAALLKADEAVIADLARALSDWGLSPAEAEVMSLVLAPVFGCTRARPPLGGGDADAFKRMLAVLNRAAVRTSLAKGKVDLGDGVVMFFAGMEGETDDAEARDRIVAAGREVVRREMPGLLPAPTGTQPAPAGS